MRNVSPISDHAIVGVNDEIVSIRVMRSGHRFGFVLEGGRIALESGPIPPIEIGTERDRAMREAARAAEEALKDHLEAK